MCYFFFGEYRGYDYTIESWGNRYFGIVFGPITQHNVNDTTVEGVVAELKHIIQSWMP